MEQHYAEIAQSLVSQAKEEFEKERQADLLALSEAVLARVLIAQDKASEAIASADSADKLLSASEDHDTKTQTQLEIGKALLRAGKQTEAVREFRSALSDSEHYHFVVYRLQAAAALAHIDSQSGKPAAQLNLNRISAEAKKKGILLVMDQATSPAIALAAQR